jgi:TonB family protein
MKTPVLRLLAIAGFALSVCAQTVHFSKPEPLVPGSMPIEGMPKIKKSARVDYPPILESSNVQGYVIAAYYLAEKGKVLSARFQGSHGLLEEAVSDQGTLYSLPKGKEQAGSFFFTAIFNPENAGENKPDALPRLLAVTPVPVESKEIGKKSAMTVPCILTVGTEGQIKGLVLENAKDERFRSRIENALPGWRVAPARKAGQAIETTMRLPIVLIEAWKQPKPDEYELPVVIKQVDPVFTREMCYLRQKGKVVVEFIVNKDGLVSDAKVLESTNPVFDDAAIDAVLEWSFKPGTKNKEPVKTRMIVPISLDFNDIRTGKATKIEPIGKVPKDAQTGLAPEVKNIERGVYPLEMLKAGTEGTAKVLLVINKEGRVQLSQIREASAPEFGLAAQACMERQTYHPSLKDNMPVPCTVEWEVRFAFRKYGEGWHVIPSEDEDDMLSYEKRRPEAILSPSRLDKALKPVSQVSPVHPSTLVGKEGSCVVEFVINKKGKVLLPRIVEASEPAFGYAAVQALSHWRFAPPKSEGKSVIVRARMPMKFVIKPKATPKPEEAQP